MQTVTIPAPPSKSLSHRALMAAALASGTSRLTQVLESEDTAKTRECLSALGANFAHTAPGCFTVTGTGGKVMAPAESQSMPLSIDVGESGTTCRLLTAILAAGRGKFRVHGSGRMHERPLGELAGVLRELGAHITFEQNDNCPPFILDANGLHQKSDANPENTVSMISCDESSQYISGLLLAAPLGNGLVIGLGGKRAVSWPYVGLTLNILEDFSIAFTVQSLELGQWKEIDWRSIREAEPGKLRFHVFPGIYKARDYAVEGDWSGASYFLAAGAIGPRPVCVTGLNRHSLQGDAALIDILVAMGVRVEYEENGIAVYPSPLKGVDVDMGHCPDLVPTVAALAAHADGPTRISNVAHLKIKESDRLAAPAKELAKTGCAVTVHDDGLFIQPHEGGPKTPEEGTIFSAHNDHRIAMSMSLLGLPGTRPGKTGFPVTLDQPDCVAKSFPHFWTLWEKICC